MSDASEPTQEKHSGLIPWKPGESGNPKGRPKGSRNKLCEAFLSDMQEAWEKEGVAVIEKVITERPQDFLKVVASLLPKEFNLNANIFGDLGEDELSALLSALQSLKAGRTGEALTGGTPEETRH